MQKYLSTKNIKCGLKAVMYGQNLCYTAAPEIRFCRVSFIREPDGATYLGVHHCS